MAEESPGAGGATSTQVTVAAGAREVRMGAGAIATLAGVAVLVIFMVQNRDKVSVDFLFWSFHWRLWVLMLVSALIGALVWFGLGVMRRHRRREQRRDERKS